MELWRWLSRRWLAVAAVVAMLAFVLGFVIGDSGGGDVSVSEPEVRATVVDSFSTDRGQLGLGETTTGQPWRQLEGSWVVSNGLARGIGSGGTTIATVDPGGQVGVIRVVVARVAPGSGVVFRFNGVENHWALLAAPAVARWNLVKSVDGERSDIESFGPAAVNAGASVVIRLEGDRIEVEVNGSVIGSVEDGDLAEEAAVGFTVPNGARASFDELIATG